MIAAFSPTQKNLQLYSAMALGLEAVGFNIQRREDESRRAFAGAMDRYVNKRFQEIQSANGPYLQMVDPLTREQYSLDAMRLVEPVVVNHFFELVKTIQCPHRPNFEGVCQQCAQAKIPEAVAYGQKWLNSRGRVVAEGRVA